MKTILLICRLYVIAILAGAHVSAFGNTDPGSAGSDSGGMDDGSGTSDLGMDGGFVNSTGVDFGSGGGDAATPTPNSIVSVHLDPATGTGHTGSPLYFTGQYSIDNTYGPLVQVMVQIIAPDGTQQTQILDLTAEYDFRYAWTTSFTFTVPGTYQVLAAEQVGGWYQSPNWSQNVYNASSDGGATWQHSVLHTSSPIPPYTPYSYTLPSNLTSFTVDGGAHPPDTVYAQAFPKPGMEKWFLPSNEVKKTFQILGKTNPAPDANGNF